MLLAQLVELSRLLEFAVVPLLFRVLIEEEESWEDFRDLLKDLLKGFNGLITFVKELSRFSPLGGFSDSEAFDKICLYG